MRALADTPGAVRGFLALLGRPAPEQQAALPELLAEQVSLSFAGTAYHGKDAVIARITAMPARRDAERLSWQVQPGATAQLLTLRAGMGPDAPGGLVALDFAFELDQAGLIARITPTPHHRTPQNLGQALRPGDQAADFILPDTRSDDIALRQPGTPAYLVIWTCNHCPWALAWHQRIQKLARTYAGKGVRTVQINANDPVVSPHDTLASCSARVEAGEFAGPYLTDAEQRIARAWGARHTPDVFVLDGDLRVVYHGAPDASHADESRGAEWIRNALDSVLAGRPVPLPETTPVGCTIKWTLPPQVKTAL